MRASVIILGFLATLTVALPEARPEAAISCQSVSPPETSKFKNFRGLDGC